MAGTYPLLAVLSMARAQSGGGCKQDMWSDTLLISSSLSDRGSFLLPILCFRPHVGVPACLLSSLVLHLYLTPARTVGRPRLGD